MTDLRIAGGLIIDGTGNPGFHGTVLVQGDRLTVLRGDSADIEAGRTLDASGYVVCPGFIDLHSHAGLTILGEPHHDPKVRQGVTTELVGVDGISHAPFKSHDELNRYIRLDAGLNGYPPTPGDWRTVPEYLDRYDNKTAINIAYILGNSPVRIWGVGWEDRPATKGELENMKAVVRTSLEEGAWALSTGLDYPPGAYATTDELIALSEVAAGFGGFYHTHTRGSLRSRGPLAPWGEALDIGRQSAIPLHLTHYRQSAQGVASHLDYLQLVEDARDEGLDVTFDCYTYPYSGTTATFDLPQWTKDGGPERLVEVLRSAEGRARITEEMRVGPSTGAPWRTPADYTEWTETNWLTNFQQEHNKQYEGRALADIAEMRQQDPIDALADLLLEEDLAVSTVGLGTNPHTLGDFISHPYGMIASDAILLGDYPNPRTYGCFPMLLAEYVRAEKNLRLPEAIRKMTSFPAQRLGLPDRGILRDNYKADIVIFDPQTVKTYATKRNPKQYPIGIDYVIVNGRLVIDDGVNTGALPGRALRRGKAST